MNLPYRNPPPPTPIPSRGQLLERQTLAERAMEACLSAVVWLVFAAWLASTLAEALR